jgi:hypothetical protein
MHRSVSLSAVILTILFVAPARNAAQMPPHYWIDPGHPDAAAYTVDVLMHLLERSDIDGLHLDRIRYPEDGVPLTLFGGTNIGYNVVNVERFQRRYGIPSGSPPPAFTDT